jgi:hypothetical protein
MADEVEPTLTARLGALSRVDARQVWRDEARDFTPWLAAHLSLLGEALGLDLELEAREVGVGPFSADIIARDSTGGLVVIENQLARTDHSHLGQLLTYAAGKDADAVVWVTPEFRAEHREALDWLNTNTGERLAFFGVEVELLRVNESLPAPHFKVVSQPNEWAKATKTSTGSAPSELGLRYQAFFTEVLRRFKELRPHLTTATRVGTGNWYPFSAGRSDFSFVWSLASGSRLRVELSIATGSAVENLAYLEQLKQSSGDLSSAVGADVVWEPLEGRQACRVAVYRSVDRSGFEKDQDLIEWAAQTMARFADALKPRVLGLRVMPAEA